MVAGNKEYTSPSIQLLQKRAWHFLLTQLSANKGIKKHGQIAIAALFKELKQLDYGVMKGKPVVVPTDPDILSPNDKKQALEAINLIKEKRDGTIKGRTCANGKNNENM